MGGNYEKDIYKHLMEMMERYDSLESENALLTEENARLRSILNQNSDNSSLSIFKITVANRWQID